MIDSDIIIKYTNSLYGVDPKYAPTYDEFRDMFSAGQLRSKEWMVESLPTLEYLLCRSLSRFILLPWKSMVA